VQGAWAIALLLSGSYSQLLDYVTFADWIFFGITAVTLVIYRSREQSRPAHYRAPLYPVSVVLFVAACLYVVAGAIVSNPPNALRGALMLALGWPVYFYWARRVLPPNAPPSSARAGIRPDSSAN
jgi:APA family basic amino acid/polyamine antiporter